MLRLILQTEDKGVQSVFHALDAHTLDRTEQVYILRSALQWAEMSAFPEMRGRGFGEEKCSANLTIFDTPISA